MGLQVRGNCINPKKKIVDTNAWNDNKRRFSLLVSASSNCSPRAVDTNYAMKHVPLGNESTEHTPLDRIIRGSFVEEGFVYQQSFCVRNYQIGPDKTVTMETLMYFLQNDFGATHEMDLRKLIWIVTRIQVQVQRYSKRGDEIEVQTWIDTAGRIGIRKDWIIRDRHTKEIIAKATSTWALMNKETRRLSKIPEEVRQELAPLFFNRFAIATEEIDHQKIHKLTDATADKFRSGVTPGWNDMDANQHVNHVKYVKWILESVPREILEEYKLRSIILEFRRECTQSEMLESMTSSSSKVIGASNNNYVGRKRDLQYIHLLRLQENKTELVRARTEWHLKENHE
ncbi:unnamed protein product [Sphenostylis stenocarpa]|uniref:Acyl-[acyl-carrier-protein] hydrolase n=1 Tax=Sphenostylis stenocarpa TaxID=92480 RepID=A0AA86VTV1_9FABA|nr:unnamed protein product [Sphenostylis stenocarpa]